MAKIAHPLVFLVLCLFFIGGKADPPSASSKPAPESSLVKACQRLDKNMVENCLQFVKPYIGKPEIKNIRDVAKHAFFKTMAKLMATRAFTLKQIKTNGLMADQTEALNECLEYQAASMRHLRRAEDEFEAMAKTEGEARLEHKKNMDVQTEETALCQVNCHDVFDMGMGPEIPWTIEGLQKVAPTASAALESVWSLQKMLKSIILFL